MKVWRLSPFTIDSLHRVGIMRDAVLPHSKTGSNEVARLQTQDGKMHVSFSHDAYTGAHESVRHQVSLSLTPALKEAVDNYIINDPAKSVVYAIRQLHLDLDLRTGTAIGKEEFLAGAVPGGIMAEVLPQTSLSSESAKYAKLPISGVPLKDFLYEILTWTTGEDCARLKETLIYQIDDDIYSNTHEMPRYLDDPDSIKILFSFVREIAQAIMRHRSFPR